MGSQSASRPVSRPASRMGSRVGSLVDLNLDHLSHWEDDDDDIMQPWDGEIPHIYDSGLHSLVVSCFTKLKLITKLHTI